MYQICDSFEESKADKEALDNLLRKMKKLLRFKSRIRIDQKNNDTDSRLFMDTKKYFSDILAHILHLVTAEQYRAFKYEKLREEIRKDFLDTLPEVCVPEEPKPEPA